MSVCPTAAAAKTLALAFSQTWHKLDLFQLCLVITSALSCTLTIHAFYWTWHKLDLFKLRGSNLCIELYGISCWFLWLCVLFQSHRGVWTSFFDWFAKKNFNIGFLFLSGYLSDIFKLCLHGDYTSIELYTFMQSFQWHWSGSKVLESWNLKKKSRQCRIHLSSNFVWLLYGHEHGLECFLPTVGVYLTKGDNRECIFVTVKPYCWRFLDVV